MGTRKKYLNDKAAVNNLLGSILTGNNRNEIRTKNKDRPDCNVCTPRWSDRVLATNNSHLSIQRLSYSFDGISTSQLTIGYKDGDDDMGFESAPYDVELSHGDIISDLSNSNRNAEIRDGHANISPTENGEIFHLLDNIIY